MSKSIQSFFRGKQSQFQMSDRSCRGAVMIEAALVMFVYLFLVGVVIYFAIYFFRYQMLHDAMASTMRSVSTDCNVDYSDLQNDFAPRVRQFLLENYGVVDETLEVSDGRVCLITGSSQCMLTAQATWVAPCIFCNLLIPFNESFTVAAKVSIEDPCFYSRPNGCEYIRSENIQCY